MDIDLETLPDLLRAQARHDPARTFARFKARSLSYGEFDARTDELAAGLAELGVRPGEVVSVFLPTCLEVLEAWWAILKAGGVLGREAPRRRHLHCVAERVSVYRDALDGDSGGRVG